ncbi:MAG: alpha/beta hydrolase [Bryobacteraceae bacterium]
MFLPLSAFRQPHRVTPVARNIEYAGTPENRGARLPVVVWVHGGGWRAGSKDKPRCLSLVREGYAIVAINYRLSGEATFPSQIYDVKAAIRWVRANAKQYGFDPERIAVFGASAGGHLAALAGTSGGVKELEGSLGNAEESSRVQAVVDWFGPTDFLQMGKHLNAALLWSVRARSVRSRNSFTMSSRPETPFRP